MKKKKALYALAVLISWALVWHSSSLPRTNSPSYRAGSLQLSESAFHNFITQGFGRNKHIELADFYFGKQYIYATKLVQFQDAYLPVFPDGEPENASNLRIQLWIGNDRNSSERLIESAQDLDRFVADFNRRPRSITGVLRQPTDRVRTLTADANPGTNGQSLQVLWARHFPTQQSINFLWGICALCLVAAACVVAYRRQSRI